MLTAALAVLCALLVLVLLVQRPAIWPVLVVLAVLWFALFGVFRYRVRSWVARWVCGGRKCCPASTCRRHARSAASCSIWPTACGTLTAPPSPARPRA